MNDRTNSARVINFTIIIIVSLLILANSGFFPELWGMSQLTFLPYWWLYCSFALLLVLLLPSISYKIKNVLENLSVWFENNPENQKEIFISISILFLIFASNYCQSIPVLGDGSLRANEIFDGKMWHPTEMLDFFAHSLLYKYAIAPLGYSATTSYRFISVLCGPFFIYNIWVLSKYIDSKQSVSVFLLFGTSGMVVLFFGYIESYSIVAAYIPLLFLWQFRASEKEISLFWVIGGYLLGGLIHSIVFILFLVPTLYIIFSHLTQIFIDSKKINMVLAILVIVGTLGGVIASSIDTYIVSEYLLPILKNSNNNQALLTTQHILNLVNWLFFVSLPFIFLTPYLIFTKNKNSKVSKAKDVAFWVAISALLFIFLFRPQLGGPRDWDLFSIAAFCLIPSIILTFKEKLSIKLPLQVIPIIFISFVLLVSLVKINNSPRKSVERFIEVIEISKFKNLYIEYATLLNYSELYKEISDLRSTFGIRAWEQPARTQRDSLFISQNLATYFLNKENREQAKYWTGLALKADSINTSSYKILIQIYEEENDRKNLSALSELIANRFSNNSDRLTLTRLIDRKLKNIK